MKPTTATRRERTTTIHMPTISRAELLEAIRLGVHDAIYDIAMIEPILTGQCMYDAIIRGVRLAHQDIARDGTFAQARETEAAE